MRLDSFLVEKGYYNSRSQANNAVKNGKIKVNGRIITKSGFEVKENDVIDAVLEVNKYVSFGGYKLQKAYETFKFDLKDKTVLDIGASTGGFTDYCLQNGASKVYAYDVGHDQLDQKIRNDERVVVKEGVNCRYLNKNDFEENIDFICMDVSFISCTKLLENISQILNDDGEAVILFKPQFEVGNEYLNRQGIVINDKIVMKKMDETIALANDLNLICLGKTESVTKEPGGNQEYLLYFKKNHQL